MPDAANTGMNHNAAHDAAHKRHGLGQKRPESPGGEEKENTERRPQSCLEFLEKEIITYTDQYGQNEMTLDYLPKEPILSSDRRQIKRENHWSQVGSDCISTLRVEYPNETHRRLQENRIAIF